MTTFHRFHVSLAYKLNIHVSAGGMSANIATFESYIKESEESQGSVVTILRQGWLLKRSSNMRREWKRRFFVLDSLGMLYYYSNKVLPPFVMLVMSYLLTFGLLSWGPIQGPCHVMLLHLGL